MNVKNDLQDFVIRRIEELGLSWQDVTRAIFASRNQPAQNRRLDEFLRTGVATEAYVTKLNDVLRLPASRISVLASCRRVELEHRASEEMHRRIVATYRPVLRLNFVQPTPAKFRNHFGAMAVSGWSKIAVHDDCQGRPFQEQLEYVQWVIRDHQEKTNGCHPQLGQVSDYEFDFSLDQRVMLDVNGNVKRIEAKPRFDRHEMGNVTIYLARKTVETQ